MDTLTLIDCAAWGLRLLVEWSRVPRRPVFAVVLERCPCQRSGRLLRVWRWHREDGH